VGSLCIMGVDDDRILKDFVRAHVERLEGTKVLVSHWYPDLVHDGKTIRYFYGKSASSRALSLLPHALYNRVAAGNVSSQKQIHAAMRDFFRAHDVDVILAEFGPMGAEILPHARELGIPLVVHFHGHDAHRKKIIDQYKDRYRDMFEYASGLLSVSHRMTTELIRLGAHQDRITYNPYGPREIFFDVNPSYVPTVLSVGRFTDIKANYLTLASFAEALRHVPEARLVMIGDGELLETCKTLASAWGIQSNVVFAGAIPHAQVTAAFSDACCFAQHSVSPSYGDSEGTPVVILEAQAAGLSIVATRHAGIPDVVIDGQTGFLVDERDVTSMAAHLRRLLSDAGLCKQLGANARAHVASNFTLDAHIQRLQHVIDRARAA